MRGMTRRGFAALVVGAAAGGTRVNAQTTLGRTMTVLDFFHQEPRAWEAVQGYPEANYHYLAGSAASASTRRLPCDAGLRPVSRATWQAIWTAPGWTAGIELAHCDDDFVNYRQFAEFRPRVIQLPDIHVQDVTATINALIQAGRYKHLVCRAKGDGAVGTVIFGSSLELIWT